VNRQVVSSALVSHHLRVLRESGLVRERRDGRWVHYSLETEQLARLRAAVVAILTPPEAASQACACSDCGPTTRRPGLTAALDAVGATRQLSS
jgi:hypothetical protein